MQIYSMTIAQASAVVSSVSWTSPLFWSPLIVSLVALAGVLISNSASRKNILRTEEMRNTQSLKLEADRAENQLQQEELTWLRHTRTQAYSSLIHNCRATFGNIYQAIWYFRPSESDPSDVSNSEMGIRHMQDGLVAADKAGAECALIWALGDPSIATKAEELLTYLRKELSSAVDASNGDLSLYDEDSRTKRLNEANKRMYDEVAIGIREDLLKGSRNPSSEMKRTSESPIP